MVAQQKNVSIVEVNPTYTSQRCSQCGWTRKKNRSGKLFKCDKCGYAADADLNASRNIFLTLPSIKMDTRLKNPNKLGFYWSPLGLENIVPAVSKT